MIHVESCPLCSSDLFAVNDIYGLEIRCVSCSSRWMRSQNLGASGGKGYDIQTVDTVIENLRLQNAFGEIGDHGQIHTSEPLHSPSRSQRGSVCDYGCPTPVSLEMLREIDIFRHLSAAQIERVASIGRYLDVPAGKVLAEAGEPGNVLLVIMEGQAQLTAHSAIGEITVRIAGPGESFPLAARPRII